jgi:metallo-beta-lactamase class B
VRGSAPVSKAGRRLAELALVTTTAGLMSAALAAEPPGLRPDPPKACGSCDEWNAPQEPYRVFGNTFYVGTAGLGAVLVTSPGGHVLLDGGLAQSAARIDANIRALGFRTGDVKLILNSHAHYDHAGGIAALQRASGATVAASPRGKEALERGEPTEDDPQYAFGAEANGFPAVKRVRVVGDGETVRVADVAITAHYTPGHTPGATTWSWRSCEGERCLDVVYADSLNAVSAPGFRFSGDASHPSLVASFERSIGLVAGLPCDILLTVHPGASRMNDALRHRDQRALALVDSGACRAYADDARRRLEARLAEEVAR